MTKTISPMVFAVTPRLLLEEIRYIEVRSAGADGLYHAPCQDPSPQIFLVY